MKKIGKIISAVLVAAMLLSSVTAFADPLPDYQVVPNGAFYKLNITPGISMQQAKDVAAYLYSGEGEFTGNEWIFVYYAVNEDDEYTNVSYFEGEYEDYYDDSFFEYVSYQLKDYSQAVIGTATKVEPLPGYHYEKVNSVSDLTQVALEEEPSNIEGLYASAYNITYPIVSDQNYDEGQIILYNYVTMVDEGGTQVPHYHGFDLYYKEHYDNTAEEIDSMLDSARMYVLVEDPEPETTTEAPTTTAAATTAATSPQTGDSAMTATFIALGVVAVCGLAVVTFSTKKTK